MKLTLELIAIEDKLPPEDIDVLLFNEDAPGGWYAELGSCEYIGEEKYNTCEWISFKDVTHWARLPEVK